MTKFCTNCGHPNEPTHRVCVECGQPLEEVGAAKASPSPPAAPAPKPKKTRQPIGKGAKILTAVGIFLLLSLIGVYSWGANAASADTVASKFFEAVQAGDAETAAKQAVLSNGTDLTVSQAEAFIRMYQEVTADEMETISTLEKRGKVIGIFDAHKVVLPAQTLSFAFPNEGLGLKLDGEEVSNMAYSDGEYIFTDLSPGAYEAEFLYEGGESEFSYPFELVVSADWEEGTASINEDLQIGFVTFKLSTYDQENPEANKVIIGEQEYAVSEDGETEKIGPLVADGSLAAEGVVEYPWGERRSEPVSIVSDYHELDTTGLGDEQVKALLAASLVFAEEYVEALGTRDFNIFTNVTEGADAKLGDHFKEMERLNKHYKGSLKQIGIDEKSIKMSKDKKTVSFDAELFMNGVYYTKEPADSEEEFTTAAVYEFMYDEESSKWLVASFRETIHPMRFSSVYADASNTYFETELKPAEVAEKAVKKEKEEVDEGGAEENSADTFIPTPENMYKFFMEYNGMSVEAINSGDFSMVSGMVDSSGPRYKEQSDFIDYLFGKGVTEEYVESYVEEVVPLGNGFYSITTHEKFIIHGTETSSQKDYRTVTKIKVDGKDVKVYELISTTEI